MSDQALRIFIVAAEPSGDALAADLIKALRAAAPGRVEIAGVGGDCMAREGVISPIDISELSVFGLFDGLKIIKLVHQRAEETAAAAKAFGADMVVLVDSWGFMLRAAWKLREAMPDVKLIKYVGPQVFAARRGRAKVLAETVDHLLAIHPFDPDYFEPHGLKTTFVGNPVLERIVRGDGEDFKARHGIDPEAPLLLVLFGSRKSEITRLVPPFAEALRQLKARYPHLVMVAPLARATADLARTMLAAEDGLLDLILVDEDERPDAFAAGDAALACSGTVTLELSRAGVPTVAAYKLGWLAYTAAKLFLMKSKYISLVNIAANELLLPECIQLECNGSRLAQEISALLEDAPRRFALSKRLVEVTEHMRGEGGAASENAARALINLTD